jgi:hypothetical protein
MVKHFRINQSKFPLILLISCEIIAYVIQTTGLHNSELLVNAGEKIINKQNPYVPMQPYGTSPALLYWLINKLSPFSLGPTVFIILNLAGIFGLLSFILPNINWITKLQIFSIVLLTSPIRAMVASVQHTGIIFGLLILGNYLLSKQTRIYFLNNSRLVRTILASLCFAFSLEIKWQLALPFILVFSYATKNRKLLVYVPLSIIILRLGIDIWVGRVLEIDQLNVWKTQKLDSLAIAEQVSPWKFLGHITSNNLDWFTVSFIVYLILICLLIFRMPKMELHTALIFSLIVPISTAYIHLYDIVILPILLTHWAMIKLKSFPNVFNLGLILLPTKIDLSSEIIKSVVFFLAIVAIIVFVGETLRFFDLMKICGQIAFCSLLVYATTRINLILEVRISLQLAILFVSFLYVLSKNHNFLIKCKISEN